MTEESSEEGAQARARERRLHLHNCSPTSIGSMHTIQTGSLGCFRSSQKMARTHMIDNLKAK